MIKVFVKRQSDIYEGVTELGIIHRVDGKEMLIFPSSLKILKLFMGANQILQLPDNLEILRLSEDYDQPLHLPSKLKHLNIKNAMENHSILLPSSIESVCVRRFRIQEILIEFRGYDSPTWIPSMNDVGFASRFYEPFEDYTPVYTFDYKWNGKKMIKRMTDAAIVLYHICRKKYGKDVGYILARTIFNYKRKWGAFMYRNSEKLGLMF